MPASEHASRRYLKSDLERVDAHRIKKSEYEDLPELTEEMLARARIKGGRPSPRTRASNSPYACQST
jgi:hypothetical protein